MSKDETIAYLLQLDGDRFVLDEQLGLWVKFDVKRTIVTNERPHGIRYSLSLHDRYNERLMGFDNAHAIIYNEKHLPRRTHDHWHRTGKDKGQPYNYKNAAKLIEDFWKEVDIIQQFPLSMERRRLVSKNWRLASRER